MGNSCLGELQAVRQRKAPNSEGCMKHHCLAVCSESGPLRPKQGGLKEVGLDEEGGVAEKGCGGYQIMLVTLG